MLLITADVFDEKAIKDYVNETVEKFSRIDGFFNNAGIEGKQDLTQDYGSNEFAKVVGLTRNSALEYGEYSVSINAIAPVAILTAMVEAHSIRWKATTGKQPARNSSASTRFVQQLIRNIERQ